MFIHPCSVKLLLCRNQRVRADAHAREWFLIDISSILNRLRLTEVSIRRRLIVNEKEIHEEAFFSVICDLELWKYF